MIKQVKTMLYQILRNRGYGKKATSALHSVLMGQMPPFTDYSAFLASVQPG